MYHHNGGKALFSSAVDITELLQSPDLHEQLSLHSESLCATPEYWLLACWQQGKVQWLVFKDFVSLVAACEQLCQREAFTDMQIQLHVMKGRQAAGLLFTRHPERLDLAYRVLELVPFEQSKNKPERWVFDEQGRFHYQQGAVESPPLPIWPFVNVASELEAQAEQPQCIHWWHDGETLFVLAHEPITALSTQQEAWGQANDLWPGVVSPLWYSCSARWLKTHFWRPLGARLGWKHLENVEPYRRQQGHLYLNAQFALALGGLPHMHAYLPPDWRLLADLEAKVNPTPLWRLHLGLYGVQRKLAALTKPKVAQSSLWQRWMHLDQLGEQLAKWLGELHYVYGFAQWPFTADIFSAFGADPALPRVTEDAKALQSLEAQGGAILQAHSTTPKLPLWPLAKGVALYEVALTLWHQLGEAFRSVAEQLGALLAEQGRLLHPDGIYFLYFDELWELIHQQGRVDSERMSRRQHQYMQAAFQSVPRWQLGGYGYQGGALNEHKALRINGVTQVSGHHQGRALLVNSSWCLNQPVAGQVVVLAHYHPAWLPWLALAGAIVFTQAQDNLQCLSEMAQAQKIPMVLGVEDAMDYFHNQDMLEVHAEEEGAWVAFA